ncbi:hypothetical protein MRX96_033366 [Rhipicephalus microplus]
MSGHHRRPRDAMAVRREVGTHRQGRAHPAERALITRAASYLVRGEDVQEESVMFVLIPHTGLFADNGSPSLARKRALSDCCGATAQRKQGAQRPAYLGHLSRTFFAGRASERHEGGLGPVRRCLRMARRQTEKRKKSRRRGEGSPPVGREMRRGVGGRITVETPRACDDCVSFAPVCVGDCGRNTVAVMMGLMIYETKF